MLPKQHEGMDGSNFFGGQAVRFLETAIECSLVVLNSGGVAAAAAMYRGSPQGSPGRRVVLQAGLKGWPAERGPAKTAYGLLSGPGITRHSWAVRLTGSTEPNGVGPGPGWLGRTGSAGLSNALLDLLPLTDSELPWFGVTVIPV